MELDIRQASLRDTDAVRAILREAARWLRDEGMELWWERELTRELIEPDVRSGAFYLATCDGHPAGTVKVQLADALVWPEVRQDDSAFIHRLAVRRRYAGGQVSSALLRWAVARTVAAGRRYLRLDCDHARPKLRAIYEQFGFRWHSDRQVGPFHVARYEYLIGGEDNGGTIGPCDGA